MQSEVTDINKPSTSTLATEQSNENEDLINRILAGQEDVLRRIGKMEEARQKTQDFLKQCEAVEEEVQLIEDEREYAYTSAWTEPITEDSMCDKFFSEEIPELEDQLDQKTHQYKTLYDFMKKADKEKKLPSTFQQPEKVIGRLKKLEADLEEANRLKFLTLVAKKAEEEADRNVREYREDLTLLKDGLNKAERETTDMRGRAKRLERKLAKLVKELRDKYNHVVFSDGQSTWRIVHKDQLPRPVEAIPDPISDEEMEEMEVTEDTGVEQAPAETESVEMEEMASGEASKTEEKVEATATEDDIKEEKKAPEALATAEAMTEEAEDDLVELEEDGQEGSSGSHHNIA